MATTPTEYPHVLGQRRAKLLLLALFVFAIAGLIFSLTQGSLHFTLDQYLSAIKGEHQELAWQVIHQLRLPRSEHAFITGALLACAGALLQILLRNPLAEPFVLGISGGASVFALLAMLAGLTGVAVSGSAFIGAMVSMLLVFGLARGQQAWSPTRLLLTGVVLATGWGAVVSFILSVAPQGQLRSLLFWLMGDLSFAQQLWPGLITLIIGLLVMLYMARQLNVLTLGGQQAQTLGIEVTRLQWQIYVLASLMTAMAVVQAGSIGFVGLIVPHVLRLLGLRDHRFLIPGCALAGGGLLLIADTLARSLFSDVVLPVGILTAALGVPVFIALLYRGRQTL